VYGVPNLGSCAAVLASMVRLAAFRNAFTSVWRLRRYGVFTEDIMVSWCGVLWYEETRRQEERGRRRKRNE
jgi:hypothetical protein